VRSKSIGSEFSEGQWKRLINEEVAGERKKRLRKESLSVVNEKKEKQKKGLSFMKKTQPSNKIHQRTES